MTQPNESYAKNSQTKDFYTIQEYSQITGVETSTLRYWDDIGLFSPAMRNPDNNYRYYSLSQITSLNFITVLSHLEIPLKTIADLRKERNPEKLARILDRQERKMDMEMRRLRLRYSIIHARRELINYGMKLTENMINSVAIMHREDKELILWPRNVYKDGDTFIEPLTKFVEQHHLAYVNLSFPVGGYYDDMDTFVADPSRPQHFFSIDPTGYYTRKAGDYLVGFTRGGYSELGDLPRRMTAYAEKHHLNVHGPVYLMYLLEETTLSDPADYLAQVIVAVKRAKRKH